MRAGGNGGQGSLAYCDEARSALESTCTRGSRNSKVRWLPTVSIVDIFFYNSSLLYQKHPNFPLGNHTSPTPGP